MSGMDAIDSGWRGIGRKLEALIYILGWWFFSLSMSVYNKWMFGRGLDFKFPILVTSFHQLCVLSLSFGLMYFCPKFRPPAVAGNIKDGTRDLRSYIESLKMDHITYIRQILPCALASGGDIGFSNASIRFISLTLYTMLKSSSLMFVLIFGLIFRLERFNWKLVFIVLIMTVSVLMMVQVHDSAMKKDETNLGITLILSASVVSGLRWSFTQLLLKQSSYTSNPISTMFYLSPTVCVSLLFLGLIFEGWTNFTSAPIWDIMGISKTILLMIFPGILAFMMTLCEFKLLMVAQVLTFSVVGIFKEVLTILTGVLIFGDGLSYINVVGLILTFVDIIWYQHHRITENRAFVKPRQLEVQMD